MSKWKCSELENRSYPLKVTGAAMSYKAPVDDGHVGVLKMQVEAMFTGYFTCRTNAQSS